MPFNSGLVLAEIEDRPEWWRLYTPLVYTTSWGFTVVVPEGFETDLASIPKRFRSVFQVNGRHRRAAVVHDYLYRHAIGTRTLADAVFRDAMAETGVPLVERNIMWAAVRFGGSLYWDADNKGKAA